MGQQEPVVENKRFGSYLRQIREHRKLSLDAVEEMTGGYPEPVTKSHLSRIENGQAIPTFPRMFALSQVYGVPISSIAEKFEIDLRRNMHAGSLGEKSIDDLRREAIEKRLAGRYSDALLIYETLLDRLGSGARAEKLAARDAEVFELQTHKVSCLLHLARYNTAKEESENLLGLEGLSRWQRVSALHLLAAACYRLGKFSIALLALEQAEKETAAPDAPRDLVVQLAMLKGNLHFLSGAFETARTAYDTALAGYEEQGIPFEACRARLNLSSALIECGDHRTARKHLSQAIQDAERNGYDRQLALALGNLGLIAYREGDLAAAQTYCVRSNTVARPRDYIAVVFRNCYYLWRIARAQDDATSARANERTLRTYLSRVEEHLPEAEEYRAHIGGGES